MKILNCVVAEGGVFSRCDDCGGEQLIDPDLPLVPQLRQVSEAHACARVPAQRQPLTLVRVTDRPDPTSRI